MEGRRRGANYERAVSKACRSGGPLPSHLHRLAALEPLRQSFSLSYCQVIIIQDREEARAFNYQRGDTRVGVQFVFF